MSKIDKSDLAFGAVLRREDMGKQDPDLLAKHFESKKPKSTKNKKEGNSSMKKTIITIRYET